MGPREELSALQAEYDKLEQSFEKAKAKAELSFFKSATPVLERRRKIVSGEAEPTATELGEDDSSDPTASAASAASGKAEDASGTSGSVSGQQQQRATSKGGQKRKAGVPKFWLTVLKKHDVASEFVQRRDEECLTYLEDVRCSLPRPKPLHATAAAAAVGASPPPGAEAQSNLAGYRVELRFAPNPFFHDKVLVKEVVAVRLPPSGEEGEDEEGGGAVGVGGGLSYIITESTDIRWKSTEKNLTISVSKKKSGGGKGKADKKQKGGKKNKKKGCRGAEEDEEDDELSAVQVRTKPSSSFFNFFSATRNMRGQRQEASSRKRTKTKKGRRDQEEEEDVDDDEEEGVISGGGAFPLEEREEVEMAMGGRLIPEDHLELLHALWSDIGLRAVDIFVSDGLDIGGDVDDVDADFDDEDGDGAGNDRLDGVADKEDVAKRIKALQHLSTKVKELQQRRDKDVLHARDSLALKSTSLFVRRREIVNGDKALIARANDKQQAPPTVPRFWLLALKGNPVTVEIIRRRDQPLLSLLADVRFFSITPDTTTATTAGAAGAVGAAGAGARGGGDADSTTQAQSSSTVADGRGSSGSSSLGITVEFEFLPGALEWMEDRVLSLSFFFMQDGARGGGGSEGEGSVLVQRCEGSGVRWKEDMELTLKEVESKRKGGGIQIKTCPSFFHLFINSTRHFAFVGDETVGLSEVALRSKLSELALALRDSVVPRAFELYSVAEKWNVEDDEEDEDDDDEEDEDGDEEEDANLTASERAARARKMAARRAKKGKKGGAVRGDDDDEEPICCGFSRGAVLLMLMLFIFSTPFIIYLDQVLDYFGL